MNLNFLKTAPSGRRRSPLETILIGALNLSAGILIVIIGAGLPWFIGFALRFLWLPVEVGWSDATKLITQ